MPRERCWLISLYEVCAPKLYYLILWILWIETLYYNIVCVYIYIFQLFLISHWKKLEVHFFTFKFIKINKPEHSKASTDDEKTELSPFTGGSTNLCNLELTSIILDAHILLHSKFAFMYLEIYVFMHL